MLRSPFYHLESISKINYRTFIDILCDSLLSCCAVTCAGKLTPMTESLALLLHHREKIVEVACEALTNGDTSHGADAILDVISNLALDLQQVRLDNIYDEIEIYHAS